MQIKFAVAHLSLALVACAPSGEPCYGDAQCPAGQVCDPRGQCVKAPLADAATTDAAARDGAGDDLARPDAAAPDATAGDAATPDAGTDDGGAPLCPPWDGVIARDEIRIGPGLSGHYRAILPDQPVAVDLVPVTTAQGPRWDLAAAVPGEQAVVLETLAPDGAWWREDFADASYAALLEIAGEVLGVFRVEPAQVVMLGVVSVEADRTRLSYDPPVVVYRFPLQVGDHWVTESTVTGVYDGLVAGFYEDYTFDVVTAGQVVVPAGSFDVLQLRMERLNQVPTLIPFYFVTTTNLKYQFVAQCYGTVATVGSQDDEPSDPFTTAREYTRLGF